MVNYRIQATAQFFNGESPGEAMAAIEQDFDSAYIEDYETQRLNVRASMDRRPNYVGGVLSVSFTADIRSRIGQSE